MLILYISQESEDDCLHVDFERFKLALWPTLRQKFINFWNFLTPLGVKHDEKISNCSSTPKRSWSNLTILPWVSRCFNFSVDKTPNLMVFSEMSFWNEMFLCSIKNGNVYCCWIVSDSPHGNAENRKLQETSRRFCETIVGHRFFKGEEMSLSAALTVKTILGFLEYIFQFFINNTLPASNGVDRQNFIGKSVRHD